MKKKLKKYIKKKKKKKKKKKEKLPSSLFWGTFQATENQLATYGWERFYCKYFNSASSEEGRNKRKTIKNRQGPSQKLRQRKKVSARGRG